MRRLILKKMNGKRKVSIVGLRQKFFAVILTMAFVHRSDAMPTNPGSLKQNIMTADISGSDLLGAGNGGGTAIGGGPQQINPQDPKLTPVRGTKDEQCSDKELLIMKLEHDLKEAENTIEEELQMLQKALCQSANAAKQADQLADKEIGFLMNALSINRNAMCKPQECGNDNVRIRSRSKISNNNNKVQRFELMPRIIQRNTPKEIIGNENLIMNTQKKNTQSRYEKHDYDYNLVDAL
ncbi:uncharacterized protein [Onthophagus taurus]|uniref:uncharacterized protein isoform X3 n=1 Tax=Onthophagus taurus TaxID=166361 RepID=UPI0039BE93D7